VQSAIATIISDAIAYRARALASRANNRNANAYTRGIVNENIVYMQNQYTTGPGLTAALKAINNAGSAFKANTKTWGKKATKKEAKAWYNDKGEPKRMHIGVITNHNIGDVYNKSQVKTLYFDKNAVLGMQRRLYTKKDLVQMKGLCPITRQTMVPYLLPTNIQFRVRQYMDKRHIQSKKIARTKLGAKATHTAIKKEAANLYNNTNAIKSVSSVTRS
jgi:hypothetical protein